MDSMTKVLSQHPDAYVFKEKGRVEIRRPRTNLDPPALIKYVLMGGWQLTTLMAWDAAARTLSPAQSSPSPSADHS